MDIVNCDSTLSKFVNTYIDKVLVQAITFGVVVMLLGILFIFIFTSSQHHLLIKYETLDENYFIEITLFAIGFTIRYLMLNDTINKYLIG